MSFNPFKRADLSVMSEWCVNKASYLGLFWPRYGEFIKVVLHLGQNRGGYAQKGSKTHTNMHAHPQ